MFRKNIRLSPRYLITAPVLIAVVLLLAASIPTQASAPAAPTAAFTCTPTGVAIFTNRVHVRCTPAAPNSIAYFAYCTATDSATASRFLSVFTTAKATGKNLVIFYDPNDLTGQQKCGCANGDCRLLTGAEIQQ